MSLLKRIAEKRQEAASLEEQRKTIEGVLSNTRDELENLERQERNDRLESLIEAVKTMPPLIDVLAPEHSRTSCSDENHTNRRNCTRCKLLSAKRDGFFQGDVVIRFDLESLDDG